METQRLELANHLWNLYTSNAMVPRSSDIDLFVTMATYAMTGGDFVELGPFYGGTSIYLLKLAEIENNKGWLVDNFTQGNVQPFNLDMQKVLVNNLDSFGCKNYEIIRTNIATIERLPLAKFYFFDIINGSLIEKFENFIDQVPFDSVIALDDFLVFGESIPHPWLSKLHPMLEKKILSEEIYFIYTTSCRLFVTKSKNIAISLQNKIDQICNINKDMSRGIEKKITNKMFNTPLIVLVPRTSNMYCCPTCLSVLTNKNLKFV